MSKSRGLPVASHLLDLTLKETLFELAVEDGELVGTSGAKLIAEMKERAAEAGYTHLYYRDPIRPGIVWLAVLGSPTLPVRGKLEASRGVTETAFPGILAELHAAGENRVLASIPPLACGVSGIELATALEYLTFAYPEVVRAWAALVFVYNEVLGLRQGAETVRAECLAMCPHAQVVSYLAGTLGDT